MSVALLDFLLSAYDAVENLFIFLVNYKNLNLIIYSKIDYNFNPI